jgi:hypothetical protein
VSRPARGIAAAVQDASVLAMASVIREAPGCRRGAVLADGHHLLTRATTAGWRKVFSMAWPALDLVNTDYLVVDKVCTVGYGGGDGFRFSEFGGRTNSNDE